MNALSYISNNLITPIQEEAIQDETTVTEYTVSNANDNENSSSLVEKDKDPAKLTIWFFILFLPRVLVVKPTLFLWFLITFPLTLFEQRNKFPTIKRKQNSASVFDDDLNGGDEIILQRDTVKGSLLTKSNIYKASASASNSTPYTRYPKSTSSSVCFGSKKMGRFLFPKKLIPKSILHSEVKKKLVLDLDETLIHSISRSTSNSNNAQSHLVEVKFQISGISTLYYVHKRPYCDLFLSKVSKWYDLVIFTASMKEYADPVIDWLETSFRGKFTKRLYRNDCILRDGVGYIKDLSVVHGFSNHIENRANNENNSNEQNNNNENNNDNNNNTNDNSSICSNNIQYPMQQNSLSEVILIDNSPVSYAMNVDNAIHVEGWISDPTDQDLLNLLPFLEALRYSTDVRNLLSLKNGERAFNVNA